MVHLRYWELLVLVLLISWGMVHHLLTANGKICSNIDTRGVSVCAIYGYLVGIESRACKYSASYHAGGGIRTTLGVEHTTSSAAEYNAGEGLAIPSVSRTSK